MANPDPIENPTPTNPASLGSVNGSVENAQDPVSDEAQLPVPGRRFLLFQAVPAWLISMLVHAVILMVMALLTVGVPEQLINVLSASNSDQNEGEIEQFTLADVDPGELAASEAEAFDEPMPMEEAFEEMEPVEISEPTLVSEISPVKMDVVSAIAPASSLLQSISGEMGEGLGSRSGKAKEQLLKKYGGTAASEAAVAKALRWLAIHQLPNGAWTFNHAVKCRGMGGCDGTCEPNRVAAVNAATAVGVLPFLGAGQTHLDGIYKDNIRAALTFLVKNGKPKVLGGLPCLDYSEEGGNMYSHGLAAIALCEAYAMTGDPVLMAPAQQALNFIIYAQDPRTGGWRYAPRQAGDTSVTGWQVMALKSGYLGHLIVPPATTVGINNFLNLVGVEEGASYRYTFESTSAGKGSPCQPIGLLCRMYIGFDKTEPAIIQGVKELAERGVRKDDIYYNYYAAQVLRHYGGPEWEAYNVQLRDWLVESQVQTDHAEGSWHFPNSVSHRGPKEGGRHFSTAVATMILEVYYRHMPLYADSAAEDDFPL